VIESNQIPDSFLYGCLQTIAIAYNITYNSTLREEIVERREERKMNDAKIEEQNL
jgi:hypothetical protein